MNLNVGQISLIDLIGQIERKEVYINKDYQRGSGIWPDSARTYFIDTILEGYPFPKIYLYQVFNEKSKRPVKEIVDGQQRITTIMDFMEDGFKLTKASKNFAGMKYSDLDEENRKRFLSYQIEMSIILAATRPELLEMFRRINAYTAPLSAAERMHATYQGEFKWFVVEQADKHSPTLEQLKIFTPKQLARMQDSEFIADMATALDKGIIEKSTKNIEDLYKKYDLEFKNANRDSIIFDDFFKFLENDLEPLHSTFIMKSYVVHSLFSAFAHCKYGLPNVADLTDIHPNKKINFNLKYINGMLEKLANAHEEQDEDGPYKDYVKACMSSTTKTLQRETRFKIFCKILTK